MANLPNKVWLYRYPGQARRLLIRDTGKKLFLVTLEELQIFRDKWEDSVNGKNSINMFFFLMEDCQDERHS